MPLALPHLPGEVHIARAAIAGEIDRLPEAHVFFATHVGWLDFGVDRLPRKS